MPNTSYCASEVIANSCGCCRQYWDAVFGVPTAERTTDSLACSPAVVQVLIAQQAATPGMTAAADGQPRPPPTNAPKQAPMLSGPVTV